MLKVMQRLRDELHYTIGILSNSDKYRQAHIEATYGLSEKEECLLAWGSTDDEQLLDPAVAKVIRDIPWKRGEVPKVVISAKKK